MRQWGALDGRIAAVAGRQGSMISIAQLAELGVDRFAVHHRRRRGHLHPVCSRVYSLLPPPYPWDARAWAALLSGGEDAVLMGFAAAALGGVGPRRAGRIEIAVPRQRRSNRILVARHVTNLVPADVVVLDDGRRITGWARTALDVAATAGVRACEILLNRACVENLFDLRVLDDLRERTPGHRGHRNLTAALALLDRGCTLTDSGLEEAVLSIIRGADLPPPRTQFHLTAECRLDFFYPAVGLAFEIDSAKYHRNPDAKGRDGRKDLICAEHRIHLIHIEDHAVEHAPGRVRNLIVDAYADRARLLAGAAPADEAAGGRASWRNPRDARVP